MKLLQKIQLFFLCIISLSATIQADKSKPEEIEMTSAQKTEFIKNIEFAQKAILKSFSFLQKIENTLTEVALLVRKGSFHLPMTNLIQIMEVLTENKMIVNGLLGSQAELLALEDPRAYAEYAFLITEFCNTFIPYFNDHINNGFKDAKPFDLKNFVLNLNKRKTRSMGQHVKPESLTKGIKQTKANLLLLHHNVKNIGLTWYNKIARTVDKYIVTPANRYHLPNIALYSAGVAFVGCYSLCKWGHKILSPDANDKKKATYLDKLITKLQTNIPLLTYNPQTGTPEVVGSKHNQATDSAFIQDEKPTVQAGSLGFLDYSISQLIVGHEPIAAFFAAVLYSQGKETWNESIYPKFAKRRDQVWNFLRGGEYRNTQQMGLTQIKTTHTFKDMVGLDEVKEQFSQIIQYIDDPEQLTRIEASPEKGWLLTGPARTGKSFSVECLCGEIELLMKKRGKGDTIKFFNIDAYLVNKFGIKDILEQVAENAPAVIFIDEIDLLGLQRVGNNQLLSDFLTAMQSSMNGDPNKIVIVIAATNNPQNIDKALRQNGRFGKEIRFEYPARKYRIQYILRELRNMAVDLSQFNIEMLADRTNQKSFEDLKAIIRNAMTRAWFRGESLTQALLEHSIDTEIHHILTNERQELPESELRIIASHFAGRALATTQLKTHTELDKVTIYAHMTDLRDELVWDTLAKKDEKEHQQKIEYGYLATKQAHDSINVKTEATIINEATVLIAGFAAEELLLGSCGFTCHSHSRDRAFKLIIDFIFGGLNPETLPKNIDQELKTKAYTILQQCHVDAMQLLKNHKDALIALTDELIDKKIMTDKEVLAVIDKTEGRTTEPAATEETPVEAAA